MSAVNSLLTSRYADNYEVAKIAVNADAVVKRKPQTVENGIIQCATALSNFCLWDKLFSKSIVKKTMTNC